MKIVDSLLEHIQPEKVGNNKYIGKNLDIATGAIYGGHVLGQGLMAAYDTVSEDRVAHSMHGYFLIPGNLNEDIEYEVEIVRDGGSFSTRRIIARQSAGTIFILAASFHKKEEGYDNFLPMDDIPGPEGLINYDDVRKLLMDQAGESLRRLMELEFPFEFRLVDLSNPISPEKFPPNRRIWFRLKKKFTGDYRTGQALLAYVSDYNLLSTSILPVEGATLMNTQMASLDHAMWFFRPFDISGWLLYDLQTPNISGARGFVRGNIYTEDGTLICSVAQEGLTRPRKPRYSSQEK